MKRIVSIALFFMCIFMNVLADSYVCQPDGSVRFAWTKYDQCCIYAIPENPIIIYVSSALEANSAVLDANGWSLVPLTNYYAFYPYTKIPTSFTHPTVSYNSQRQTHNGSTAHLSNYDFMTSQATSTNDACHFNFKHLGCILRVECNVKEAKTLTTLTLSSESKDFTVTATMDIAEGTLTKTECDSIMTLDISGITVGEEENLVAYMMMSPTDLSDKQMTVTLTADDGSASIARVQGTEIMAGHAYPLILNMPAFKSMEEEKEEGNNNDDSSQAKRISGKTAEATTTIQNPTAYASDFYADTEHAFEQIVKILGDVNGDKEVMVNDAVMLINHYLEGQAALLDPEVADVNGDGVISIADAVAIINIFLSK